MVGANLDNIRESDIAAQMSGPTEIIKFVDPTAFKTAAGWVITMVDL